MKFKPHELLILFLALIVGATAFFVQSLEPKETTHADTATPLETPPAEFFTHQQTIDEEQLLVTNPNDANQVVTDFFNSLSVLLIETPTTTTLTQTKSFLSEKTGADISNHPNTAAQELSRFTGLLTPPQEIKQLHTAQRSPETIDITVQVTMAPNQTIQKIVTLVNEDDHWKIDAITTLE